MGNNIKRAARARQKKYGESYSTARMRVLATLNEPATPRSDSIEAQISRVLDEYPDLTIFGFRRVGGNGAGAVSRASNPRAFHKERSELLEPVGVRQVERCIEYLALLPKTRSAKPREGRDLPTSYGLKHRVEGWLRSGAGRADEDAYTANGAIIVAALIAGVPIHPEDRRSPNCYIGVQREDVRALQEGKDPREWRKTSKFVKWLFAQADRPDPVGDLAGDCKRDFDFPRRGTLNAIRQYLADYGEHISELLEEARAEYRRTL